MICPLEVIIYTRRGLYLFVGVACIANGHGADVSFKYCVSLYIIINRPTRDPGGYRVQTYQSSEDPLYSDHINPTEIFTDVLKGPIDPF